MYWYLVIIRWYSLIIGNYWLKLSKSCHLSYRLNIGSTLVKQWFKVLVKHWWASACFKKKTLKNILWPLFMDGVQLPQGWSHFEEAVYFLQISSQKSLVLILSTLEGWRVESTLGPPSDFEHKPLDWESSALTTKPLM